MNKREQLRELRDWATEREQAAQDARTLVSVCARCGLVLGTKPAAGSVAAFSHGIGPSCAAVLYPELVR